MAPFIKDNLLKRIKMTIEEARKYLCNYDTRNPEGVSSYLDKEEIKEAGHGEFAKEGCYCDNCHRGNTKLAEAIIKLMNKI